MARGEPRYARRVDSNQAAIVDYLIEADGVNVWISGHPVDLIVEIDGRIFLWEIKQPGKENSYTNAQRSFRKVWTFATIASVQGARDEIDRQRFERKGTPGSI